MAAFNKYQSFAEALTENANCGTDTWRAKAEQPAEEAMQAALQPVVSAPRKTITMASLIGKKAAAELAPFDSSAAVATSRKRKRQRDDELLLLM